MSTSGVTASRKMVKFKPQDKSLRFTGTRFEAFLRQYELAANLDGASEEDMVLQIPSFVGGKDVQDAVWDMSGYETKLWSLLKEQMIERWGQLDIVPYQYTVSDLHALNETWVAKDGITSLDDFRSFKSSFDVILSDLIRYQHLSSEDLSVNYFFYSFSPSLQQRIKSNLVREKKMVKTLDGRYLLPSLSVLQSAVTAEMEEEVAFTSQKIKPVQPIPNPSFSASNDVMKKMESDCRPKSDPRPVKETATIDEISKMLQSFEQRMEKKISTIQTSQSSSHGPRIPMVCFYCVEISLSYLLLILSLNSSFPLV